MRKLFSSALAILVLTAASWPQASSDSTAAVEKLPPGTFLSVELSTRLDTGKCRANDKIEAKTVTDLLEHGQIIVPRNTEIVGHIADAKAHSKSSPGSMVRIAFDRMLLKDGREVPLQGTVQAIAPPLPLAGYGGGPDSFGDASAIPQMPRGGVLAPSRPATANSVKPVSPSHVPDPLSGKNPKSANSNPNALDSTSRGVFGINGLSLETAGSESVLSLSKGNIHLDGGTQLTLRVP